MMRTRTYGAAVLKWIRLRMSQLNRESVAEIARTSGITNQQQQLSAFN